MDDYLLRNLGYHLAKAERQQELVALVEDPQWRRSQRHDLGSDAAFLADLQRALAATEKQGFEGLLTIMRLSLLEALVRSASSEVDAGAIGAQAQQGEIQLAFERAQAMLDPRRKTEALLEVADQAAQQAKPGLAAQALAAVAALIPALPWPLRRATLWAEVARIEAMLGHSSDARANLDQALAIIRKEQRQSPSQTPAPAARINLAPDIQSQVTGVQRMAIRQDAAAVAGAVASVAVACAQLGNLAQAQELLTSLRPGIQTTDYAANADKTLSVCALRLARLDLDDLARLAITAIAPRPPQPSFTAGPRLNLSRFSAGPTLSPFAMSALIELADALAALDKFELVLHALQLLPSGASGAGAVQDSKTAEVLAQVDDSAFLANWMAEHKTMAGPFTRAVVLRRLVELGADQAALVIAGRKPKDLATVAAALLGKGDDRQGEAVLQQALTAGSRAEASVPLKDKLAVAQVLAEAGYPQKALAIWQRVREEPSGAELKPEDFEEAGVALAAGIARSGHGAEAQAFVERNLSRTTHTRALAAVGLALVESDQIDQARAVFAQARQAAPGMLRLEDRIDALETLLDALISAQEFDLALDVARSLDRIWAAGAVVDEPGILFRKATARLDRAVGFRPDEDLAIDTSPDNQVSVIEAIADTGDYRRAWQLARGIDNISAQEDLLPTIAEAAAKAGDMETAFAVADELEDDNYILDDLQALAADAGDLGKSHAATDDFKAGSLSLTFAAEAMLAQGQDKEAEKRLSAWIDFTIEVLHDADSDMRTLGAWLVDVLFAVLTELRYHEGVKRALSRLSDSRRQLGDEAILDDHEEALTVATAWLCDAGYFDEVRSLLADFSSSLQRAALSIEIVCLQTFAGASFDAAAVRAWLDKTDIGEEGQVKLFDEFLAATALGALRKGQVTTAQRSIAVIHHHALKQELTAIFALTNGLRRSSEQIAIPVALNRLGALAALSDRLASFLLILWVEHGGGDLAQAVLRQMRSENAQTLQTDQASMWWWFVTDACIKRTGDGLRRLTQSPQGRGERSALALVQALIAADPAQNRENALQLVEEQLSGACKIAGLIAVARPAASPIDVPPRLAWRALAIARDRGLWDVLLHLAGLTPLLHEVGGAADVLEASQLCERIEKDWLFVVG